MIKELVHWWVHLSYSQSGVVALLLLLPACALIIVLTGDDQ